LKDWNRRFPVDETERVRNRKIGEIQGKTNPSLMTPTLAERIAGF